MGKRRLTREDRYQIEVLIKSDLGVREMGRLLDRCPSVISREIERNTSNRQEYRAKDAHQRYLEIRSKVHPPPKIVGKVKKYVIESLRKQWSPEQISGRGAKEGIEISHQAIYDYVYAQAKAGGSLWKNLRRKRRNRRARQTTKNFKNSGQWRKNNPELSIENRPEIVEERTRLGDIERDLIIGRSKGAVLLTCVDRVSRLTKITKVDRKNAAMVHYATVHELKKFELETLTNDNGPEFSMFHETSKDLEITVYFNHPYSSWERGTNENTNGLIRQYFPKGTDFDKISQAQIKLVEEKLNTRPRKILGFKTPYEIHQELSRGVALSA